MAGSNGSATLGELFARAQDLGIEKFRTLSKVELAGAVREAESAAAESRPKVRLEREGGLATIVLDDRATRNALTPQAMDELDAHLEALEADDTVRVVAVTGEGPLFCSGGAIREHDGLDDGGRLLSERGTELLERLASLPVPVVALINGHATGGGVELALACDIRVADPEAELRLIHAELGIVPGWGGLGRLSDLLGSGTALMLVAGAAKLTSRRAAELGLVDDLVGWREQEAFAATLAGIVEVTSRDAVAAAKRVLRTPRATRGEAERDAFVEVWPGRRVPEAARA